MRPNVSVIIGVYKDVSDLWYTVDTVLRQTLETIEVVIVDDGNCERDREEIRRIEMVDSRIKVLRNSSNEGLTASLILGCERASGHYLARIDNGDLMIPKNRLEQQSRFLDKNQEIAVVGGGEEVIDCLNRIRFRSVKKKTHMDLVKTKSSSSLFAHTTIMMRKKMYTQAGGYAASKKVGQDRDLWPRMLMVGKGEVFPIVYSVTPMKKKSISVSGNNQQIKGKIESIRVTSRQHTGIQKFNKNLAIFVEWAKLLIPIRTRVFLRYFKNMSVVGRLPRSNDCSMKDIYSYYFGDSYEGPRSRVDRE